METAELLLGIEALLENLSDDVADRERVS
jgi:hypothetical protein